MNISSPDKILHPIELIGGLLLLIHSRLNIHNQRQRMLIVGAMSVFLCLALSVYGQFHIATLRALSLVSAYRISTAFVAGITCGLLLPIVWPDGHKAFLWIYGLLFIAFNIFIFTVYHFRDGRAFYSTNAVFMGMAIATIVLYLQRPKQTEEIPI